MKASEEKKSDTSSESTNLSEIQDYSYRCGYMTWKPNWLQRFNTPRWLLAALCWYTFTQGFVVNGIIYVNLASWERRYGYSSTQSAWIASSYDVVASITTLMFAYLGQFVHKSFHLGVCAFFMAAGSFTMCLPQLLSDPYEPGLLPADICQLAGSNTTDVCDLDQNDPNDSEAEYYYYYWILILGQALHAVGGGVLFTLGVPYIDENIKTKNTPLYIGIIMGFAAFGPAMGYACGGLLLSIYVDFLKVDMDDVLIEPSDPRWVGAWWIALLYSGCASVTVGFLFLCFPKELPSGKKYRATRVSQAYKGKGDDVPLQADFGRSWRDVWSMTKNLFTNPVWIFLTLAGTVESGAIIGFAAFLPKYVQFQFSVTATEAAIWAGIVVIPGAAGGQILGGLIPKWAKARMRGLLIQCLVCGAMAVVLCGQFLLRCNTIPVAGVTVDYFHNFSSGPEPEYSPRNLTNECQSQCTPNCTTNSYDPVCGEDNIQYFNPCYAGCVNKTLEDDGGNNWMYLDCSCIRVGSSQLTGGFGESNICQQDCNIFYVFLFLFFLINVVTFVSATAGDSATIRSLPDRQRAYGVGIQRTIVRLLGNVPGPIIIGNIFDSSCIVWQDDCGKQGSCWIYNTEEIAYGFFSLGLIVKAFSTVCFTLALILYKPPPLEVEEMVVTAFDNGAVTTHDEDYEGLTDEQLKNGLETNYITYDTMDVEESDLHNGKTFSTKL